MFVDVSIVFVDVSIVAVVTVFDTASPEWIRAGGVLPRR
jgi:hypothetical protein